MNRKNLGVHKRFRQIETDVRTKTHKKPVRKILAGTLMISVLLLVGSLLCGYILYQHNQFLLAQQDMFVRGERIFTFNGATFVRHQELPVDVTVFTSTSCDTCESDVTALLATLRRSLPTLSEVHMVDIDTEDGKQMAHANDIAYVPTLAFNDAITSTEFYKAGEGFFIPTDGISIEQEHDATYLFYPHALGAMPKKYISLPSPEVGVKDEAQTAVIPIPVGADEDAQENDVEDDQREGIVRIVAFMTTDCAACTTMFDVLGLIEKKYADDITSVTVVSAENQQEENDATKALLCANEQGEGRTYLDQLFTRQKAWLAAEDKETAFVSYAKSSSLDTEEFSSCLSGDGILPTMIEHEKLFDTYGITSVPTVFINDSVFTGVQTFATLDNELKNILAPIAAQTSAQPAPSTK